MRSPIFQSYCAQLLWVEVPVHRKTSLRCFVCDEIITGKFTPLLVGATAYSKTELPTKIGQLMGDRFMVVVSASDSLCKRCTSLLNQLDRLELNLDLIKKALKSYLRIKYQLDEEDDGNTELIKETDSSCLKKYKESKRDNNKNYEDISLGKKRVDTKRGTIGKNLAPKPGVCYETISEKLVEEVPIKKCRTNSNCDLFEIVPFSNLQENFNCDSCNCSFNNLSTFKLHSCAKFDCAVCGVKCDSNENLLNHMNVHLTNWTCQYCRLNFNEESIYKLHLGTHTHNSGISETTLNLPKQNILEIHSETNKLEDLNFQCKLCTFKTNDCKAYTEHIITVYTCKLCRKSFHDDKSYKLHLQSHNAKSYVCGICSQYFENEYTLIQHCIVHNSSKNPQFSNTIFLLNDSNLVQDTLNEGEVLYSNSSQYVDADKKNSYEEKSSLYVETNLHICSSCSQTFPSEFTLKEHEKIHQVEDSVNKEIAPDHSDKHSSGSLLLQNNVSEFMETAGDESFEEMFESINLPSVTGQTNETKESYELQSQNCYVGTSQNFSCSGCNEKFEDYASLQIHELTHHCEKPDLDGSTSNNECSVESIQSKTLQSVSDGDRSFDCDFSSIKELLEGSHTVHSKQVMRESSNLEDIYAVVCKNKHPGQDLGTSLTNVVYSVCDLKQDPVVQNISIQNDFVKAGECDCELEEEKYQNVSSAIINGKKFFICWKCDYKSSDMIDLKAHVLLHKAKRKDSSCDKCGKFVSNEKSLQSESLFYSAGTKCLLCGKEFSNTSDLKLHHSASHEKHRVTFTCQYCSNPIPTKRSYEHHKDDDIDNSLCCNECKESHSEEAIHKDIRCQYCGKAVSNSRSLKTHELRHITGQQDNFQCSECKKVFKTKTGLRHHSAVHTGQYKYCCDFCGRGFMSKVMMDEHRSKHTKEERYVCDVCGRKFIFQSTYWIHRKWHDNPFPYKCNFCGRMFRHSSLLAVHKRKHTGERPYKCPHCSLTFPVGGTLKRHLILHTGVYPFNCELCKRGFTTRHKFAVHLSKIHGDHAMLESKPQKNEFKMVVRDEMTSKDYNDGQLSSDWQHSLDSSIGDMSYKLEDPPGSNNFEQLEATVPYSLVPDDFPVGNIIPNRVVEVVLDDTSQAVATVTLADPEQNILTDLWYQ